jgi:hypothetical protein
MSQAGANLIVGESTRCKQVADDIREIYIGGILLGFIDVTRINEGLLRV